MCDMPMPIDHTLANFVYLNFSVRHPELDSGSPEINAMSMEIPKRVRNDDFGNDAHG